MLSKRVLKREEVLDGYELVLCEGWDNKGKECTFIYMVDPNGYTYLKPVRIRVNQDPYKVFNKDLLRHRENFKLN
jgi:hypothetical protein